MDGDKLVIEITEGKELSSLQMIHADGKKEYKTISFFDFIDAVRKDVPISTGLLPPGTRMFNGGEKTFNIIIEQPAMKYVMVFNKKASGKVKVPVPATLFSIGVNNGKLVRSEVASFVGPLMDEAKKLYYFPYGNANTEICWGSARPGIISGINGVYSIIARFMDSHFNGDLANFQGFRGYGDMIQQMSERDTFPQQNLVGLNKTFSRFKRDLFK